MFVYIVDIYKNHYLNFEGRTSRAPNNYYLLLGFIISTVFQLLKPESVNSENAIFSIILGVITLAYGLGSLLPSIGLIVRRLHDLNQSGWLGLIILIPIVGWAFGIYLMAARGTVGPNNYGEDPTDTPLGYSGPKVSTPVTPSSPVTQ